MEERISASAHPIQGLIKYHGLRDEKNRIPFHESISVCVGSLQTVTTVHFSRNYKSDHVTINGRRAVSSELSRVSRVVDSLRRRARTKIRSRIVSRNSLRGAKGVGFSASAFASLGLAASKALGLELDLSELAEIVRLGAGSATRSIVGGFSSWRFSKGVQHTEGLASPKELDLGMVIVPLQSPIKTDQVHRDVLKSPFFQARLRYLSNAIVQMRQAIGRRDVASVAELTERDTLNLHAMTMTGDAGHILFSEESIRIMEHVKLIRRSGLPAWFSMDTGPTVFVNTSGRRVTTVARGLLSLGFTKLVTSRPGGKPRLVDFHLF